MRLIKHSIGLILVLCSMTWLGQAQDKTEKGTLKIDLTYHRLNEDLPVIKVSAKTKRDRKFEPVEGVAINLFLMTESAKGFMGQVTTNHLGAGSLTLPTRFREQWDSLSSFTFIGTVTQNPSFQDQSTELEIQKARIEIRLDELDSVRTIHAKVLARNDTGWVAQPETEIKLVVRGLMSDLKATEDETFTTDSNGEATSEFNLIIPGDAVGNVLIGAKIDDHEVYGSLVSSKTAKWGLPLVADDSFSKRTLWATRDKTPLWLLIFPNLIILTVWGIIFYLFYQVVRLVKLGKSSEHVH